jgi:hypothetical protein
MQFISPIWLFSIVAIIIPVLIHLWNIRPAKVLKVGSISLIGASSRKRSRSFNLLDLLLLLLRCLFVALLAFFLAAPFLQRHEGTAKTKGWLLIPKENFKETYQKFKPKADSLLKSGYELHYFDAGFAKANIQQALVDTGTSDDNNASYWDLLRRMDRQVSSKIKVYLLTPGNLTHFTGDRPKIASKPEWLTYTRADSASSWIQGAWFATNKDIHVVLGTGKPSGVFFTNQTISMAAGNSSIYTINTNKGRAEIGFKNNRQKPVPIDTAALTVEVFADKNILDAGYVKAVLQTVAQFTGRAIVIRPYVNGSAKADWLFWLTDKQVDARVAQRFDNVLSYEAGTVTNVDSWMSDADKYILAQGQPQIPLYKSVGVKNYAGDAIWHDGFGHPVLTREMDGKGTYYHFYSRFSPAWNDLVWNDNFPQMMLRLIVKDNSQIEPANDKRVIANQQAAPGISSEVAGFSSSNILTRDLTNYFWLLAALLFFTERWLAHKTNISRKERVV